MPGLKVICVASPYDAKGLLKSAIRDPNPVIFLEHKKAYRAFRQEIPDAVRDNGSSVTRSTSAA